MSEEERGTLLTDTEAAALETPSGEYDKWLPKWEKVRDVSDGEDAVKEGGETYLPKTSLMQMLLNGDGLYEAYKERASFFNGTGRTVDGLLGLVFRTDPKITVPEAIQPWVDDFNLHNQSLTAFSKMYLEEIIEKNRVGLFIDYPFSEETITAAEAEARNIRPFAVMYKAENIMDWDEERINNVYKTSYVMLREFERKRLDLSVTLVERRRVLDLVMDNELIEAEIERLTALHSEDPKRLEQEIANVTDTAQRFYRQRVFEKIDVEEIDASDEKKPKSESEDEEWFLLKEFFPVDVNGNRFQEIPFFPTTDRAISWSLNYSMIFDLASVNVSLYRNSADLENINHVATNPTPCGIGLMSKRLSNPNIEEKPGSVDEQVSLGLNTFLEFDAGGEWGMLEASGEGAKAMEAMMDKKRHEMALLGSRILATPPKGVESAETVQLHSSGEEGVLSSAVDALSETMEAALAFMYKWQFGTEVDQDDISVEYNKDFLPAKIDAATVTTALQAIQQGEFSSQEIFDMMQKGEWISADKTFEDHLKEIKETQARKPDEEEPFNI